MQMIRRKSDFDENGCTNNNICNGTAYRTKETINDSNNNTQADDASSNNDDDDDDNANEIDNVSLEILWKPQSDTQITADVVFIHGLHGKRFL